MKDIKSMTLAELGAELKVLGEPAFRAKQIYRWMHRGVRDFSEDRKSTRLNSSHVT